MGGHNGKEMVAIKTYLERYRGGSRRCLQHGVRTLLASGNTGFRVHYLGCVWYLQPDNKRRVQESNQMSTPASVANILSVIASWLDPVRRKEVTLLRATGAAEELLKVIRKQGRYEKFTDKKRAEYEIHYQKQFDAWKDGTS